MQRPPRRSRQLDQRICPVLAHTLIHLQRLGDARRRGVRHAAQGDGDRRAVLDRLRGALREMRQGGVAGVADEGGLFVDPGGEGFVDAQLPLADFAFGHVVEHALDEGAEVGEDTEHGGLGALGGVGGVGGGGEVGVGLGGGEVVDGVVGDRVGDDVAALADPADHPVAVDEGLQLGVVLALVLVNHDAVGGLVGVLDGGGDAERLQHRDARLGLDAVGGE